MAESVKSNTLALENRPRTWADLRGQEIPVTVLTSSLAAWDIKPGYLFQGSSGCGKTSAALLFARALFCEARTNKQNPCYQCRHCKSFDTGGGHPDLMYVDGASERSVGFVRDNIIPFLQRSPWGGQAKVVIIDEVQQYQKDAISAFLTLLEKLPHVAKKSTVILCTTDSVPETIHNRCMPLMFGSIDPDTIADVMHSYTEQDIAVLRLLAEESHSSFRTVWSYIEAWKHLNEPLTENLVMKLVGGVPAIERKRLWSCIAQTDIEAIQALWKKWLQNGARPRTIGEHLRKDLFAFAAQAPDKTNWLKAISLWGGALQVAAISGSDSALLGGLISLCGLPLDSQDAERAGPAKRQPTNFVNSYDLEADRVAQRLLFFGS